jgi:hypothetical protein
MRWSVGHEVVKISADVRQWSRREFVDREETLAPTGVECVWRQVLFVVKTWSRLCSAGPCDQRMDGYPMVVDIGWRQWLASSVPQVGGEESGWT